MYDPGIGRWLEEDPSGFDSGDSNLHRYVGNRPVDLGDPSGLQTRFPANPYANPYAPPGYGYPDNTMYSPYLGQFGLAPGLDVLGPGGEVSTSAILEGEHRLYNLNPYGPYHPSPYSPSSPAPNQTLGIALRGSNVTIGNLLGGLLGAGPGNAGTLTFGTCVGSSYWGSFWISQTPGRLAPFYFDRAMITFAPNSSVVDATAISFIQIVKVITANGNAVYNNGSAEARQTGPSRFTLDRRFDEDYAWYNYGPGNTGPVPGFGSIGNSNTNAVLLDNAGRVRAATFSFETFAVAKDGDQAGQIYGGIRWGFSGNNMGTITYQTPTFLSRMTPEFINCCGNWNAQALGGLAPKNSPNQQVIGVALKNP